MRSSWIIGLVCLVPAVARASPEADAPRSDEHELLERRLFLPGLFGFSAGTTLLALGPGVTGISTSTGGIFSYGSADMTSAGSRAHLDAFSFNPSFDVRVGRFTLGGGVSIVYTHGAQDGASSESTGFLFAPRVGYLAPVGKEVYLWPRVSAGFLAGEESATGFSTSSVGGFVASADLLLVVGLGKNFFLTAGPSGSFESASDGGGSTSSFGIGASVGIGVAL